MGPVTPPPALAWDGNRWAPVEAPACGETLTTKLPVIDGPTRVFLCDKQKDHEEGHREVQNLHDEGRTMQWCHGCYSAPGDPCMFVIHQLVHLAVMEA